MNEMQVWYEGDLNPSISDVATVDGAPVDLTGKAVTFSMRPIDSDTFEIDHEAIDNTPDDTGLMRHDWDAGETNVPGFKLVSWEIITGSKPQTVKEAVIEIRAMLAESIYVHHELMKNTLNLTGTDAYDQDLMADCRAASRAIDKACGRIFYKTPVLTRYFTASNSDRVWFDDLASLTSLKTDPASDGTYEETWLTTDYRLGPLNAASEGRPWTHLTKAVGGTHSLPSAYGTIAVEGEFGWPAVPPSIEEATAILVGRLFKRKRDAPFGVVNLGLETAGRIVNSDPDVQNLIRPFSRRRLFV